MENNNIEQDIKNIYSELSFLGTQVIHIINLLDRIEERFDKERKRTDSILGIKNEKRN